MRLVVSLLLVTAAFAGCVASEGQTDSDSGSGMAPEALPDDQTGAVTGTIVDEDQLPLAGADVAILGLELSETQTDAVGQFTINGIAPGAHKLAAQKLGYEAVARNVEVRAGETTTVTITMVAVMLESEIVPQLLIGQGYIACGAYLIVVTVSNLNVCPWDTNHKPRFEFPMSKATSRGVLQELVWQKNQALSATEMYLYIWYKPVCAPTCDPADESGRIKENSGDPSPIRQYSTHKEIMKAKPTEDPYTLSSLTFVAASGNTPAVIYQQRLTHYITVFHNGEGDPEAYTAIPDE